MNKYTHWWNHLWYRLNHSPSSIVQDGGDTTINGTVLIYFWPFPDLCHHIGRGINPHGRAITGSVFRCGYSGLGIHVHVWVFVFWVFMLGFGYSFSGILIWVLRFSVQVWVFRFGYSCSSISHGMISCEVCLSSTSSMHWCTLPHPWQLPLYHLWADSHSPIRWKHVTWSRRTLR